MNIKTKLTYGIGLLFVLITLLGGLAIKTFIMYQMTRRIFWRIIIIHSFIPVRCLSHWMPFGKIRMPEKL